MVIHNTLHNRQPQPGAAGAARAVATHKRLEQVLTLFRLNARPIVLNLEPGAMRFRTAADLDPAIAITGGVDHHIGDRAFNRQRMHFHLNTARLQRGINFPLVAAFRCNNLTQHGIQIGHLHRHFLTGTQVIDELFDNGVALFDVLINGLREIAVLFTHHFGSQADTRQRCAQIVAHARHQQGTVISQLLHARRHMVEGAGHRAHLRRAILAQRRRNHAFPHLQRSMFKIDQWSVLDTNKQPCAAYRQQHNRQRIAEQRGEIALMDFRQRHAHPDIGRQPGFQPDHRRAFVDLNAYFRRAAQLLRHLMA